MFNRIDKGMYWDRAWKLVEGCTPVSEGCAHCWSARETRMRANNPNGKISMRNRGLTLRRSSGQAACTFNGRIRLREDNMELPLRTKKPTVWAIWNDLFHEDVPADFVFEAYKRMWAACHHVFMILTKRPERMRAVLTAIEIEFRSVIPREYPAQNIWLGVTAENQEQADKRIPLLLRVPAARRYVSIEPMLGPVSLNIIDALGVHDDKVLDGSEQSLDWVICGGESGPGARPMHPDWPRSLRDQCVTAGVPFFFKQWGEWCPRERAMEIRGKDYDPENNVLMALEGKKAAGRVLDGKEYLEVPKLW